MDPKKTAKIFSDAYVTMSKLPKKMHQSGNLSSIEVTVPREKLKLEYETITDPIIIDTIILCHNILNFRQTEDQPLVGPNSSDPIYFGADTKLTNDIITENNDIPPKNISNT